MSDGTRGGPGGLVQDAVGRVDAACRTPEGLLALRESFYRRHGGGLTIGLGRAELDFTRWAVRRGVFAPGASAWWSATHRSHAIDAEVASSLHALGIRRSTDATIQRWLDFLGAPTPVSWYRAHNRGIVTAYLAHAALAHRETEAEQLFVGVLLARVLLAQLVAEGAVAGRWNRHLAHPRLPLIGALLRVPTLYPARYPLGDDDARELLGSWTEGTEDAAPSLDHALVPQLDVIFATAAALLEVPELATFVRHRRPLYPHHATPPRRRRIAVLGGGPAALGAVFHLTSFPGWEQLYDVTVYQPGWRLGGKATTGRGPHGRVEELGIHILQGWYDNTFRILRQVFAERRQRGLAGTSHQSWHEAVEKDASTFLTTRHPGESGWSSWTLVFPQDDLVPGTRQEVPLSRHLRRAVALAAHLVLGSPHADRKGVLGGMLTLGLGRLFADCPVTEEGPPPFEPPPPGCSPDEAMAHAARDAAFRLDEHRTIPLSRGALTVLRAALDAAWWAWVPLRRRLAPRADRGSDLETTWQALEWLLVSARGVVLDTWDEAREVLDLARLNAHDYRAWLASHGAAPAVLASGLVKFMYYGSFANKSAGDMPGRLAADVALRMVIETLFYKGSLVWKTTRGSGTSMICPIFEVLRARGVDFRFFHHAIDVVPEGGRVARIVLAEEARLAPGRSAYDPLVRVDGDPDFPTHPLWDQLDARDAAELQRQGIDLESSYAPWTPRRVHELVDGVDFDEVVVAIPVSALAAACPSLVAADARWRRMIDTVPTVGTFAAQTWLGPTQRQLGYRHEAWGLRAGDEPNSVIYDDPVYSWTDMTRILAAERWPEARRPRTLAYFCGTLPDVTPPPPSPAHVDFPRRARDDVRAMVTRWMHARMGWFWPAAVRDGELDLGVLVTPDGDEVGEDRMRAQHVTANVDPRNQYVLAHPGTDAARLRPDDSGWENLAIAGDWTDFGLNVGHLEGAVVSGIRAARAVMDRIARARTAHRRERGSPVVPARAGDGVAID